MAAVRLLIMLRFAKHHDAVAHPGKGPGLLMAAWRRVRLVQIKCPSMQVIELVASAESQLILHPSMSSDRVLRSHRERVLAPPRGL